MPGKKLKPVIRENAVPVRVYNEGLVVYLYDEGNTERLRELLRKHRLKNDFFSNLQAKKFQEVVTREALCVAYTLEQDDPISAEVGTGAPLSTSELQIGRWHEPQTARLSLPTGRLRVDTPNTMPLDADPPDDPGATVPVDPGDYILTLYRIDWDEMRRAGIKTKLPEEFILLTPAQKVKNFKDNGPILEFTPRQDKSWISNFEVQHDHFDGRLYFYGYWEGFWLNLQRAAAKKLGLTSGSRLRIETERLKIDALLTGNFRSDEFIAFYGKEEIEKRIESFKEFAFGEWNKMEGREILQFKRHKAARPVIERHLDAWIKARVVVLPERWQIPDLNQFGSASPIGKNAIQGAVIVSTSLDAVLNFKESDLQNWNLQHGDRMTIRCGKEVRTLIFSKNENQSQRFHFLSHEYPVEYEKSIKVTIGDGKCFAQKRGFGQQVYGGSLPVEWLSAGEEPPLVGYFDRVEGPEKYLRIRPMQVNGTIRTDYVWVGEDVVLQPWSRQFVRGATLKLERS
jgi:hypothetical protein